MKQGWKQLTHRKNLKSCSENGAGGDNSTEAVNAFYKEIKNVDFNNPVMIMTGPKTNGHFMTIIDKYNGMVGVGCTPDTVAMHNYDGSAISVFILRESICQLLRILSSSSTSGGTTINGGTEKMKPS